MAAGDLTSRHNNDYGDNLTPSYDHQFPNSWHDNHTQGQAFAQTFQNGMMVPKTMYGTAHDDSFFDGSNGVRYTTAAGFSGASMANSANTRNKPNMAAHASNNNLYNPQNVFQYQGFPDEPISYGGGGIFNPSHVGQMEKSSWTNLYGQFVPAVSQERVAGPQAMQNMQNGPREDDNRSEAGSATTCDSHCDLSDPCTGETCANEVDACTDRNCPEKNCSETATPSKLPLDVVTAAATLAKIGVPEFQEQHYNLSQQALPTPGLTDSQGSFSQDFNWQHPLDPSILDISQHILWAHGDPNSSNCTRPCPVDNPMVFGHCHFPQQFNMDSSFSNPFGNINSFANSNSNGYGAMNNIPHDRIAQMKSENCGREIANPDEFVQHFNQEHRPAFVNSMGQVHGDMGRRAPPNLITRPMEQPPYYTSNLMMSPSLSSTPHTSSPHEPFPPTPQSLPQRPGTSSRLASTCHSRSSSTAKNGSGTHRCLWCLEEGAEPCGMVFADAEGLHTHVSQEHIKTMEKRGVDGFVCCWENCKRDEGGKKGFPQRSKIERHMQTHIGRKPFKCDECGNQFSARQALDQHKLIHTNEKPLKCDWKGCEQTFRQQSALTMHKRTHTKEKPLVCPHCGKAFSESSNLSKHKRIHEGKGKFNCDRPRCEKSFHRKDQLRRHVLLHEQKEAAAGDRRMSMLSSVSSEGATGLEDESSIMTGGLGEVRSAADDSFDSSDLRDAKRVKLEGNLFAIESIGTTRGR